MPKATKPTKAKGPRVPCSVLLEPNEIQRVDSYALSANGLKAPRSSALRSLVLRGLSSVEGVA